MESAPAAAAGRRRRAARRPERARRRTMPVTFAEIKEVDEESAELPAAPAEGARAGAEAPAPPAPAELARAGSEPAALHRAADT